jgi:hypothetical protein
MVIGKWLYCKLRPFEGSRTFRLTFCLGRVCLGDPDWASHRQSLADCAIGFGRQNGQIYIVTGNSDDDVMNPTPGTLWWGAIQDEAAVDHLSARHAARAERGADHEQFQDLGRKRRQRAHSRTCLLDDSVCFQHRRARDPHSLLRFYGTCHDTQHCGACQVQSTIGRVS